VKKSGSHSPFGTLGDLQSRPVNRIKGFCETCGAGLPNRGKRFCGPCYDVRQQVNIAKNHAKHYAKIKAARDASQ
jgi:hypothetical protein